MKVEYGTLDYRDSAEVREYFTHILAISGEDDEYHFDKTPEFVDRFVLKARREDNASNTFAGLARAGREMIGVHLVRRLEEGPYIGAHVAGSWVAEQWRRRGVAKALKALGESWARRIGAHFMSTNVLVENAPMHALNRALGYRPYRIHSRKRL